MRRFLCLWFPHWPTDRWRRWRVEPGINSSGPLALTARGQGGVRLTAVDAAAAALGLGVGISLADARALVPDLLVADAEPDNDALSLARLADWCGRYSPWCAVDGADGIRLDITGCTHLFGGETGLLTDLKRRLRTFGFTSRMAIADTPAAAWGWARYRPKTAGVVMAPGDTAALLGLPVMALRLEDEAIETLNGLGLSTIGNLTALPRGPLAQRLGDAVLERLDRMFGHVAEPISPRAVAAPWLTRRIFAESIGRREDIDAATLHLVTALCKELSLKGLGARRLELAFYRVDGAVQRLAIGTSRPSHAPAHLVRLFAERLETVDPGFGIEAMTLEATEAEAIESVQNTLPVAGEIDAHDLAGLVDRLQNRLGRGRVVQLVPVESHVPERAERRTPATLPPHASHQLAAKKLKKSTLIRRPWPQKAARPLKLLSPPEPIEATALIPDDPPMSFRWKDKVHRIAAADGPERIGPEWWKPASGPARDYYRIEDSAGQRFWVYREGLYGAPEPPRWFLHGFFP